MSQPFPKLTSKQVVELRPKIQRPSPTQVPLDVVVEQEPLNKLGHSGNAATLFLVGSECRFRCVMCDLWKFTHTEATPSGYLIEQVQAGLKSVEQQLCASKNLGRGIDCIKLYNASNFFATTNVPKQDLSGISKAVATIPRVVVENHPSILSDSICEFRERISGQLEIALGLETSNPEILAALNKSMDLDCFRRCTDWLGERQIDTRAFALLNPPGLTNDSAVQSCLETIRFAESCSVRHVSVIPTRSGNGAIDHLEKLGLFSLPTADMLESVMQQVEEFDCVVTADLWDWQQLAGHCEICSASRRLQIEAINLTQRCSPPNPIACQCRVVC